MLWQKKGSIYRLHLWQSYWEMKQRISTNFFTWAVKSAKLGEWKNILTWTTCKKAQQSFVTVMLKTNWKSSAISEKKNKLKISETNVKSVMVYGSETWRVTTTIMNKIQTFINRCLHQIFKIKWFEKIPNTDLWERTNQELMCNQIKRRK